MRARRPATILAAATLVGAAGAVTAAPASAVDATDAAIITCVGREVVKPGQIVVTCADGIVETYKVRFSLGRVASGPDGSVFPRMTIGFPDGGPAPAETATYTLDNARP